MLLGNIIRVIVPYSRASKAIFINIMKLSTKIPHSLYVEYLFFILDFLLMQCDYWAWIFFIVKHIYHKFYFIVKSDFDYEFFYAKSDVLHFLFLIFFSWKILTFTTNLFCGKEWNVTTKFYFMLKVNILSQILFYGKILPFD